MNKTSLLAATKILASQAVAQALLRLWGLTAQDACLLVYGGLVLLPLFSGHAQNLYSQATGSVSR